MFYWLVLCMFVTVSFTFWVFFKYLLIKLFKSYSVLLMIFCWLFYYYGRGVEISSTIWICLLFAIFFVMCYEALLIRCMWIRILYHCVVFSGNNPISEVYFVWYYYKVLQSFILENIDIHWLPFQPISYGAAFWLFA